MSAVQSAWIAKKHSASAIIRNYSIARKRGHWPASEDISLIPYLTLINQYTNLLSRCKHGKLTQQTKIALATYPYNLLFIVYITAHLTS